MQKIKNCIKCIKVIKRLIKEAFNWNEQYNRKDAYVKLYLENYIKVYEDQLSKTICNDLITHYKETGQLGNIYFFI